MSNHLTTKIAALFGKETSEEVSLMELSPFWDFQIFERNLHTSNHWLVEAYYAVWRFFHYGWGNPCNAYRDIKGFLQRGKRGYADCDVWSLDSYLNSWLPAALRRLKATKQGVPSRVFEPEDCGEDGSPSEEGMKRAETRWNDILDQMIVGFEAGRRMEEGLYEEELGEYPMEKKAGVSAEAWLKICKDRRLAVAELTRRDEALFKGGLQLFIDFYGSLWD